MKSISAFWSAQAMPMTMYGMDVIISVYLRIG